MSIAGMIVLRIIHIVAGALWFGTAAFVALFLGPAVQAVGPAGGQVMQDLVQTRRLPVVISTYMGLSILSGVLLAARVSGGFSRSWMASANGGMLMTGALFAIAAAVVGVVVSKPAAGGLAQLAAQIQASGSGPTPVQLSQREQLQAKLARSTRIVAALLGLAAAAMASARYL